MTAKCAFFVTFYNVYQVNMLDITCQMEKKMNCGTAVACCKDQIRAESQDSQWIQYKRSCVA